MIQVWNFSIFFYVFVFFVSITKIDIFYWSWFRDLCNKNEAGYTATTFACEWGGAVIEKINQALRQKRYTLLSSWVQVKIHSTVGFIAVSLSFRVDKTKTITHEILSRALFEKFEKKKIFNPILNIDSFNLSKPLF